MGKKPSPKTAQRADGNDDERLLSLQWDADGNVPLLVSHNAMRAVIESIRSLESEDKTT